VITATGWAVAGRREAQCRGRKLFSKEAVVFDLDQFIADCRAAVAEDSSHKAVREIVARAVAEPGSVLKSVGEPRLAGIERIYHGPDLTILNVVWAPMMTIMPHEHRMWAVIGVYTGAEDNTFWRRTGEPGQSRVEAAGARSLRVGDAEPLGRDIVHSVTNPIPRLTGAIHVYGGDFFAVQRSEWDPEALTERPYDVDKNMRLFTEANARLAG
jgi:predicted metal-dependent enzyme (double-stranded beta helix superfamily)